MVRGAFRALAVAVLFTAVLWLAVPVAVQAQGDYLDVYTVKVKPEKIAEFNALTKKMVDANRRQNGDRWLTSETMYGEGGTYVFVSFRKNYADVDTSTANFMTSLNKSFGKEMTEKMMRDWESCLASSRSELRRRRWDLSSKAPSDPAEYAKFIGESRVVRTIAVHIRPGHAAEFESLLQDIKAAGEKNDKEPPFFVSQGTEGTNGSVFYVSFLRSSLGGFDGNPTIRQLLGDEGMKKYAQVFTNAVETTESALYRFSPTLSNPPEEIVSASANFWRPKMVMSAAGTAKPKAASAAVKPAAEKPNN